MWHEFAKFATFRDILLCILNSMKKTWMSLPLYLRRLLTERQFAWRIIPEPTRSAVRGF